ncbi:hypothetical protein WME94_09340 [Sorangium sp. So ce429]
MKIKITWDGNAEGEQAWLVVRERTFVYVELEYARHEEVLKEPIVTAEDRGEQRRCQRGPDNASFWYIEVGAGGYLPHDVRVEVCAGEAERPLKTASLRVVPVRARRLASVLCLLAAYSAVQLGWIYLQLAPSRWEDLHKVLTPAAGGLLLLALQAFRSGRRLPWLGAPYDPRIGGALLAASFAAVLAVPGLLVTKVENRTGAPIQLTRPGEPTVTLDPEQMVVFLRHDRDVLLEMVPAADREQICVEEKGQSRCEVSGNERRHPLERLIPIGLKTLHIGCKRRELGNKKLDPELVQPRKDAAKEKESRGCADDDRLFKVNHERLMEVVDSGGAPADAKVDVHLHYTADDEALKKHLPMAIAGEAQGEIELRMRGSGAVRHVSTKLRKAAGRRVLTTAKRGDAGLRIEVRRTGAEDAAEPHGTLICNAPENASALRAQALRLDKARLSRLSLVEGSLTVSTWQSSRPEEPFSPLLCMPDLPATPGSTARDALSAARPDSAIIELAAGWYPEGFQLVFPRKLTPEQLDIYHAGEGRIGHVLCNIQDLTAADGIALAPIRARELKSLPGVEGVLLENVQKHWSTDWSRDPAQMERWREWIWACAPAPLEELKASGQVRQSGSTQTAELSAGELRMVRPPLRHCNVSEASPDIELKDINGYSCAKPPPTWEQLRLWKEKGCGSISICRL